MMNKRHSLKRLPLKLLFSTAFIFGAATLSGTVASAHARSATFAPQVPWTIGPIANGAGGQASYCSMKNAYAGGRTLVFARGVNGKNSIAVDFADDMFTAQQRYGVTARAGRTVRHIKALAASPQILVMLLSSGDFEKSIRSSRDVSFAVLGKTYRFGLDVSASKSFHQLQACTDSIRDGVPFAQMHIPLAAQVRYIAAEKSRDVQELTSLQRENADLMRKNKNMQKQLAARLDKIEQHAHDAKLLKSMSNALMRENNKMRAQLSQNNTQIAARDRSTESLQAENNRLMVETQEMRARLNERGDQLAESNRNAQSLQYENNTLALENTEMRRALAQRKVAPVQAHQDASGAAPAGKTYLKDLLTTSNIVPAADIKTSNGGNVMHWQADGLFGSAQQVPMTPGASLKTLVDRYLQKTAALCTGEYAKNLHGVKHIGSVDVLAADITCVNGAKNAGAAVLFVAGQGKFRVVTQEGTVRQLATAMSDRDSIADAVSAISGD